MCIGAYSLKKLEIRVRFRVRVRIRVTVRVKGYFHYGFRVWIICIAPFALRRIQKAHAEGPIVTLHPSHESTP